MWIINGVLSGGGHHRIDFRGVVSIGNLFRAWQKFSKCKRLHSDVAAFELRLEENLFSLHERLADGTWSNDPYERRRIADPKPRVIHIPSVRDRVLFQAVYQQLYQVFDQTFIHDSYASRIGKGTHAGVRRLEVFTRKVSANHTKPAFVLKCDIRKFFDHIDHDILFSLISKRIIDDKLPALIRRIISSFETASGKGLPLGNVTSQLFANIYLNELDQFMKHTLKMRHYIRYCDDFVIVSENSDELCVLIPRINEFLKERLRLYLHPHKISIRTLAQGADFLGYVVLPRYRVLRTRTRCRMFRKCEFVFTHQNSEEQKAYARQILCSYKGLLSHGREYRLWKQLEKLHDK